MYNVLEGGGGISAGECVGLRGRSVAKAHMEYELKVRQKECVPSRFDTRLWLYGCTDMCNMEASD